MFEGKLIKLRAMEEEDLELVRQWNFDPIIRESFVPSVPVSRNEQHKWYERQQNDPTRVKLIILDKESNEPIGIMSAMRIDHLNKNCEVGWTIGNKNYWTKGYSIDAACVFCRYLFEQLNMHLVYGYVLETNKKALHFDINKIGFIETGHYKEMIFKDGRYLSNIIVCLFKDNFYNKMREAGYDL